MLYEAVGVARSDVRGKMCFLRRNFEFFGAPVGLIFTIDRGMCQGQCESVVNHDMPYQRLLASHDLTVRVKATLLSATKSILPLVFIFRLCWTSLNVLAWEQTPPSSIRLLI